MEEDTESSIKEACVNMGVSFAEMFEESLAKAEMRTGSIIKGVVVDIHPEAVVVNAGLKSEGVIPKWQFLNAEGQLEVNIGDTVDVALDMVEDGLGDAFVS